MISLPHPNRHRRFAAVALAFLLVSGASAESPSPGAARQPVRVATFDSGFGGFLTAKSIEAASHEILEKYDVSLSIRHYGDTKNSPYGEKTTEQIALLGSQGVVKALDDGADLVFIACNTASTQYEQIKRTVERIHPGRSQDVVSIIQASVAAAKEVIDQRFERTGDVNFAILATPATVKSMAYPRQLAAIYGASLDDEHAESIVQDRWFKPKGDTVESMVQQSTIRLGSNRAVHLLQLAPGNWVDLIERGANLAEKNRAVKRDLGLLFSRLPMHARLDGVGYFCTHYPVLGNAIRLETQTAGRGDGDTRYIAQGPLMAELFKSRVQARLHDHVRARAPSPDQLDQLVEQARARITISGTNVDVTRSLARTMFPGDADPVITQEDFVPLNWATRLTGRLQPGYAPAAK